MNINCDLNSEIILSQNFAVKYTLVFTAKVFIIKIEGVINMTKIRPVSDLRNYNEVLNECSESSPVYLTKKGRGNMYKVHYHHWQKKIF